MVPFFKSQPLACLGAHTELYWGSERRGGGGGRGTVPRAAQKLVPCLCCNPPSVRGFQAHTSSFQDAILHLGVWVRGHRASCAFWVVSDFRHFAASKTFLRALLESDFFGYSGLAGWSHLSSQQPQRQTCALPWRSIWNERQS